VFDRRHIDLNKQYVFLKASSVVLARLKSIDWHSLGKRTTAATPNFCKGDVVAAYEALSANIAATTRKPHMWTAPSSQGFEQRLIRSLAFICPACLCARMSAGQDGFRDVSSKQTGDLCGH
jgi:hypothetical protein